MTTPSPATRAPTGVTPPRVSRPMAPVRSLRVMQVGKFYPPHEGGMETHLQALCRNLRHAVDLDVVVSGDGRRSHREVVDGVHLTRAGTWLTVASAPLCPRMILALRSGRPDLVHLHHPNPSAFLSYLASGHRGPLVVTYHSDIVAQRTLNLIYEPVVRRVLDRADAIIVSSREYFESSPLLRHYADRTVVIPFGVETGFLADPDPADVQRIRDQHGPRIVLTVGRLVYYKGIEFLLDAMPSVDAKLLVVGQGPLRAQLAAQVARLGVSDRVSFIGRVPQVAPYYHAADVFVLASHLRSEAFGLVQLEAMACGLPVVNARIASGVPFVSLDGVTGITVPPADSHALAAALNTLLDDAPLRRAMGDAGRRRVADEFSLELMGARTVALYSNVMTRPAVRRRDHV
ncbi:MAG: hypothetical protein JWO05_1736 [Gemmatimonadetes bacterium]|nr:hypothetical protein [Gemmatimonadota bacterium]